MKEQYIELMFCQYLTTPEFMKDFGNRWIPLDEFGDVAFQIVSRSFKHHSFDSDPFLYRDYFSDFIQKLKNMSFMVEEGDEYTGEYLRFLNISPNPLDNYKTLIPIWDRVKRLGLPAFHKALKQIDLEIQQGASQATRDEQQTEAALPSFESSDELAKLLPDTRFFDSEERKQEFLSVANDTYQEIEKSDLTNSQKASARGYLAAAKALSENPDPPVELIWDILNRANNIAGIGSFFLSLIMLLAMVAG